MSWSAKQYSKFEAERNRPSRDLLAQLPLGEVRTAVDLGCGPGNSTELLQAHFPSATVTGMDSSPDMIEAARKRLPGLGFEVQDISSWPVSGPFDLIFANAALQWVPDHASLLPALMKKLTSGGRLAVQVPDNLEEPAHRLMREVAAAGPWFEKIGGITLPPRHDAIWYYRELKEIAAEVDVWRTTYYHRLEGGVSAIVEWFKGTGLRPFLSPLDDEEQAGFLAAYETALAAEYPVFDDETVVLPFPRLFFIAKAK